MSSASARVKRRLFRGSVYDWTAMRTAHCCPAGTSEAPPDAARVGRAPRVNPRSSRVTTASRRRRRGRDGEPKRESPGNRSRGRAGPVTQVGSTSAAPIVPEPGPGWVCENSRISGEIGLVETEKSVALFPDTEGPLFHGWSRTWQVTRRKGRKKPPRIAALGGYSRGRSRKAEISGRRSTRRCRSGSRLSAPKCGICVVARSVASQGGGPGTGNQPTACPVAAASRAVPPRRAGGYNRS